MDYTAFRYIPKDSRRDTAKDVKASLSMGAMGDRDFRISDFVKNSDGTDI